MPGALIQYVGVPSRHLIHCVTVPAQTESLQLWLIFFVFCIFYFKSVSKSFSALLQITTVFSHHFVLFHFYHLEPSHHQFPRALRQSRCSPLLHHFISSQHSADKCDCVTLRNEILPGMQVRFLLVFYYSEFYYCAFMLFNSLT